MTYEFNEPWRIDEDSAGIPTEELERIGLGWLKGLIDGQGRMMEDGER